MVGLTQLNASEPLHGKALFVMRNGSSIARDILSGFRYRLRRQNSLLCSLFTRLISAE